MRTVTVPDILIFIPFGVSIVERDCRGSRKTEKWSKRKSLRSREGMFLRWNRVQHAQDVMGMIR